jgi:hypothetical protein
MGAGKRKKVQASYLDKKKIKIEKEEEMYETLIPKIKGISENIILHVNSRAVGESGCKRLRLEFVSTLLAPLPCTTGSHPLETILAALKTLLRFCFQCRLVYAV